MKKIFFIVGLLSFFNAKSQNIDFYNDDIQKNITNILGKSEEYVFHAPMPFDLGFDAGGAADIYIYKNHLNGVVYLTADLIGEKQKSSDAGNYELMICVPDDNKQCANLISHLAYYTLEATLKTGHTMDLGGNYLFDNSAIKALIFSKYDTFNVKSKKYGLMLVMGITADELAYAKEHGGIELLHKLKESGVFPMTILERKSIFTK